MEGIKIAIVDDNPRIVQRFFQIFQDHKNFEVIGVGSNGFDALKLAHHQPDVMLMDIDMPKMNGLKAARKVKMLYPNICLILLTNQINTNKIVDSITNGVHGIIFKDMDQDEMIYTIKATLKRKVIVFYPIQESLVHLLESSKDEYVKKLDPIQQSIINILEDYKKEYLQKSIEAEVYLSIFNVPFSDREREVTKLLLKNYSNAEIAASLFLSLGTVKNYLTSLYKKLGVSTRKEAIRYLKGRLEEVYSDINQT